MKIERRIQLGAFVTFCVMCRFRIRSSSTSREVSDGSCSDGGGGGADNTRSNRYLCNMMVVVVIEVIITFNYFFDRPLLSLT